MPTRRLLPAAAFCLLGAPALAQPVRAVPQAPPQGSPLPGIVVTPPPVAAPAPQEAPAAPATTMPHVALRIDSVSVDGATAYTASFLSPLTAGLTGSAVPLAAIEAARVGIVNRYRADGYVFTAVNARIVGTTLHFVVTEGRIVAVKLSKDIGPAGTQVLRFLNRLLEVTPITTAALERALLLAADIPGLSVRGVLNPSVSDPGALTLVADVSRTPLSGQISADNRAFRQTGPEEFLGLVNLNSYSALGEQTQISVYHSFLDTNTFGQIAEDFYLGGSGLKLHVYGGAGDSTPSGTLSALGYNGFTRVFGAALSYPVIRSRQQTLIVSGLFDGLESDISLNVLGRPARNSFDSLRIFRAEAEDSLYDGLLGPRRGGENFLDLRISKGVPGLGAEPSGAAQLPRLHERTDFTSLRGEYDRDQTLTAFGQAALSYQIAVAGQYSGDVLPPEEKFYLGGPHFDSGFYYGEVTGDKAAAVTTGPRLDVPLAFVHALPAESHIQLYAFYDWGEAWQNAPLELGHVLRSAGAGFHAFLGPYAEFDLEGVYRLTRTPDGTPPQVPALKSAALYWQVVGHF